MENVKQLLLFVINYSFAAKVLYRQGRNIVPRIFAQKYSYRNDFF